MTKNDNVFVGSVRHLLLEKGPSDRSGGKATLE